MKNKFYILTAIATAFLVNAQRKEDLSTNLESQKLTNQFLFEKHWANTKKKDEKAKNNLASRVDFFFQDHPFFLKEDDTDQLKNSNVDALQNGQVAGLSNSFNGQGIQIYEFDGGRVFANHTDFGGTATTPSPRIFNYESSSLAYSDHSTNVASMMNSNGTSLSGTVDGVTITGNTKGVAPQATINSYAFATTILPGNTTSSTVYQKIQNTTPALSNHSYGSNMGWSYEDASSTNSGAGWYWNGQYDPTTGANYDLQGTYYTSDKNYDALVRNTPSMVIVKSSGNYFGMGPAGTDQPAYYYNSTTSSYTAFPAGVTMPANNCASGYDCIGSGSLGKNIIVVGANEKILTNSVRYSSAADVVKAGYTSVGARDDGAIKPDITAVGSNVFSASYNDTTGNQSWAYGSGTSYAAPLVTGVIGLWNQISKTLFNTLLNAASAKTLLAHSAYEAGSTPGPDAWFGWGMLNAKKGAELLVGKSNNSVLFDQFTLNNNATFKKNVAMGNTNGSLKVTISWVDVAFTALPTTWSEAYNNRTSRLINDLDLRIIDTTTNTVYMPWKLDINNLAAGAIKGDNKVDNIEQVVIDNAVANRTYRIEITHKGTLSGGTSQDFSLLAEGPSSLVLGTQETVAEMETSIFPTITKDFINVLSKQSYSKIQIHDTAGNLIIENDIKNVSKIDVSKLPKGLYLISVFTNTGTVNKKFLKE